MAVKRPAAFKFASTSGWKRAAASEGSGVFAAALAEGCGDDGAAEASSGLSGPPTPDASSDSDSISAPGVLARRR